ncbi:polyprenyl synthetase family protein [Streptomyces sp. NPDC001868]|uniref:polyprenyl synthetase family protein n=1 Tax=Streptomyces sp. NPDC001868 TaxID=3154401 RepID=UPI003330FA67
MLGAFGDPLVTGKPCLDDLRDGKNTVLVALAMQRAGPAQQSILRGLIGNRALGEDGAARVRRILDATGARTTVEHLIRERHEQARQALARAPFPPAVTAALLEIARAATVRAS